MHLVGFIISIYRDARSPERQILQVKTMWPALSLKAACSALCNLALCAGSSAPPPLPNSGSRCRCIIYIEYSRKVKRVLEIRDEIYKIPAPCEHNVPGFLRFFPWRNTPNRAQASSLLMFLERTQLDASHSV